MTCMKDAFPSIVAARKVARRQMDHLKRHTGRRVQTIEAYRCDYCGMVHITGHNELKLKKVG